MNDGCLLSDCETRNRNSAGTTVGMQSIKNRRIRSRLSSHPDLAVGSCVPFYFCPRSIMLYLLHMGNHHEISYRGGQEPIVHLVVSMSEVIEWADSEGLRWAFTLSNAGSSYFEDRNDIASLHEIDWHAVHTRYWSDSKEGKQAEFLVENEVVWRLIREIGVFDNVVGKEVMRLMDGRSHKPTVKVKRQWYY